MTYGLAREIIATQIHVIYVGVMKAENNSKTIWLSIETNLTCIAFFEFLNEIA